MWTHENYPKKNQTLFKASYFFANKKRFFRLCFQSSNQDSTVFVFDSWQSAKKNGWIKIRGTRGKRN